MSTERHSDENGGLITRLAEDAGLPVVERIDLPERRAHRAPLPPELAPRVRDALEADYADGVYGHQAEAIAAALGGRDVCVATSTASGKSLIFMTVAADLLVRDPHRRVVALYPARALMQDQIEKWRALLGRFDLRVGLIDGGVATSARGAILESSHVVLMTPDVAHAWLLARAGDRGIRRFLERLALLVLDEAHVYDGVFGTNMAYFLRRLDACAARARLIATTATVGEPQEFVERLTGRSVVCFDGNSDGSPAPLRTVLLANGVGDKSFQRKADLLKAIAARGSGRFLAFGDSRLMVERMVVSALRSAAEESDDDAELDEPADEGPPRLILPYRAGYETEDRREIQEALTRGTLAGVVSTSALELGLDIGDIDLVVLLNPPTSVKSLWQRIGRTGRRRPGVCLLVDDSGLLVERGESLADYLGREIEPNWLYLDNRYIQYTNALCAAHEQRAAGAGSGDGEPFATLSERFRELLANELTPTQTVADDLYPLKQRAQAGPHREFPLRSDIEPNFQVQGPFGKRLGTLSYGQVLREGYPGAVYYYMARPHRVIACRYRQAEIIARRERYLSTRPLAQTMVFPRFNGGTLALRQGNGGFVAESEVQVSERVTGFRESRGKAHQDHLYGPDSEYSTRELTRFFPTTGVCWFAPNKRLVSDRIGAQIVEAYCATLGVQSRDIGHGAFHATASPLGAGACLGMSVFDSTHGSLRLTQRLAEHFPEVVDAARTIALARQDHQLADDLAALRSAVDEMALVANPGGGAGAPVVSAESEWVTLIAPGSQGMYRGDSETREVVIRGHRYTPRGLLYELEPERPGCTWLVAARDVTPIFGRSELVRVNLVTGEAQPTEEAA